ncbi:MAG TPA: hypothetical protein VL461_11735 [Dictyobacter sp.]|nr:hypothetical protein [Dictyobacter sp.]
MDHHHHHPGGMGPEHHHHHHPERGYYGPGFGWGRGWRGRRWERERMYRERNGCLGCSGCLLWPFVMIVAAIIIAYFVF